MGLIKDSTKRVYKLFIDSAYKLKWNFKSVLFHAISVIGVDMKLWKKLKKRYWDTYRRPGDELYPLLYLDPTLQEYAKRITKLIREKPLEFILALCAVIGVLVTIIR